MAATVTKFFMRDRILYDENALLFVPVMPSLGLVANKNYSKMLLDKDMDTQSALLGNIATRAIDKPTEYSWLKALMDDIGFICVEEAFAIAQHVIGLATTTECASGHFPFEWRAVEGVELWHIQQLYTTHVFKVSLALANGQKVNIALQIAKDCSLAASTMATTCKKLRMFEVIEPHWVAKSYWFAHVNDMRGRNIPFFFSEWLDDYERLDLTRATEPVFTLGERARTVDNCISIWKKTAYLRGLYSSSDGHLQKIPLFSIWEGDFVGRSVDNDTEIKIVWVQSDSMGTGSAGQLVVNGLVQSYVDFIADRGWIVDYWNSDIKNILADFTMGLRQRFIREHQHGKGDPVEWAEMKVRELLDTAALELMGKNGPVEAAFSRHPGPRAEHIRTNVLTGIRAILE